jgi:hypothetical protein
MTKPAPTPPTKTVSPSVRAARAFNRIAELRAACEREIAEAPESIRLRYAARIEEAKRGLTGEALTLLERMLGK